MLALREPPTATQFAHVDPPFDTERRTMRIATRRVTVSHDQGLHLRPCMAIVNLVSKYRAKVMVRRGAEAVEAAGAIGALPATGGDRLQPRLAVEVMAGAAIGPSVLEHEILPLLQERRRAVPEEGVLEDHDLVPLVDMQLAHRGGGRPRVLNVFTTSRCNFACAYCSRNLPADSPGAVHRYDSAADFGCERLRARLVAIVWCRHLRQRHPAPARRTALNTWTWTSLTGKPSLATVATSGSYTDLLNKPQLFDGTWTSLSGKPVTLAGYGITDGMSTTHPANTISSGMISKRTASR